MRKGGRWLVRSTTFLPLLPSRSVTSPCRLLPTLHPQVVSGSGIALTPPMILALALNVVSATVLFAYLLGAASTVKALERRVEALQYLQEEGG